MALKVLIADDHPLFLRGTRQALEEAEDIEVVGEAHSGTQALALVRRANPDVVVMDIRMPGMDGLTCLERIRQQHPSVKVIILSADSQAEQIDAAFRKGASAYVVKSVEPVDLPSAIRQAVQQTVFQAIGSPAADTGATEGSDLTERELTILRAAARGLSNKAISEELWVTQQTVKFHLTNIYRKLGVSSRTEAARYAHSHGLIESVVEEEEGT